MKTNQKTSKYNIAIRLVLSFVICFFLIYTISESAAGLNALNLIPVSSLFVAAVLFAINKKVADYISFSIYVFLFGGLLPFQFLEERCLDPENFNICIRSLFFSKDALILLLLISPLAYLILNFIKQLKK